MNFKQSITHETHISAQFENRKVCIGSTQIVKSRMGLVNKRPQIQNEFKLVDGNVILRIELLRRHSQVALCRLLPRPDFFIRSLFLNNYVERVSHSIVNLDSLRPQRRQFSSFYLIKSLLILTKLSIDWL